MANKFNIFAEWMQLKFFYLNPELLLYKLLTKKFLKP